MPYFHFRRLMGAVKEGGVGEHSREVAPFGSGRGRRPDAALGVSQRFEFVFAKVFVAKGGVVVSFGGAAF
jgi:hypothetical protein